MTARDERREKVNRWREANQENLLTIGQINDLPDGTILEIVWTGGNGPHEYELRQMFDAPHAVTTTRAGHETFNVIDFVGDRKFHTQVITKGRYAAE